MTIYPASEKQVSFVRDLIAGREVEADLAAGILEHIEAGTYDKRSASSDIDAFLKLPKRAKATGGMQALLARVPKSKYAVPTLEFEATTADEVFPGDLVFIEVKEYMSTLYARQLHGAPGDFTRSKLSASAVKALVEIIERDPYKYVKLFGDHYTCCGSCGAVLTDEKSRELMLGPECRKKFGF
jgi:hypothetical protein